MPRPLRTTYNRSQHSDGVFLPETTDKKRRSRAVDAARERSSLDLGKEARVTTHAIAQCARAQHRAMRSAGLSGHFDQLRILYHPL